MAIKNQLGLVCDPVAGLVEIPCIKRNVGGTAIALSSADLALAGVESRIPFDDAVEAMNRVGKASRRRCGRRRAAASRRRKRGSR